MKRWLLSLVVVPVAVWWVSSTLLEALAAAFSIHAFFTFLARMGRQIALLDCIVFIATLEILLVPALTYWVFPASMPIESRTYFTYALPACLAFYIGIRGGVLRAGNDADESYVRRAAEYLRQRQGTSSVLFVIGLAGFLIKSFVPDAPSFVSTLPMYALLISALYAYYGQEKYRRLLLSLVVAMLLMNTVRTGMFGDLFFWLLLLFMFGLVRQPKLLTNKTKTVMLGLAFAFLLLIQSVKSEYRYHTWGHGQHDRTANASLMADLLTDRLTHPEKLLNIGHFFMAFVRFNQGIMIGSAMAKVPVHEPYAQGEVLLSVLYPLIPRLLWPGKPQTGGYENIRRFTTLPQFENTSINLSPLGEGYVNFGYGGIFFTFVYGSLLGGCFRYVLQLAGRTPSLILWLPMLFAGCLTMETDLLSTWGSLLNSALFTLFLFGSLKRVGVEL